MRRVTPDEFATILRRQAAGIEAPLRSDIQEVAKKIKASYQAGVGRYSGRTAAGAKYETAEMAGGLRAIIGNTHFASGFHEYGGARSAPNPAMHLAVKEHTPEWIDRVSDRRRLT